MQIKACKKITDFKFLNLFEVRYMTGSGRLKSWQLASRQTPPKCMTGRFEAPDAVIIAPYHRRLDRLVVTREYRIPLGDWEYGFPAGLVDAGETPLQTAGRELKEETGLELRRVIRISPPIYSSAGMTDESVAMVFVECDGEPSVAHNCESELIEVLLITADEAAGMIADAQLKFDARAWLVLARFAESGHI